MLASLFAGAVSEIHVPLNVPDVTETGSCIMERLSRFFVRKLHVLKLESEPRS